MSPLAAALLCVVAGVAIMVRVRTGHYGSEGAVKLVGTIAAITAAVGLIFMASGARAENSEWQEEGAAAICQQSGAACSADCHNLLQDKDFGPSDCTRVFDAIPGDRSSPLERAGRIKCGERTDFAYWTDDEFIVRCWPEKGRRRETIMRLTAP